ncbi:hypothetical protein BR93DRAFT_922442 [Coniochaeta sp. PMI_546]|nr:hypothetical protein BR93DRAFT_922442 [Coniochaeta sp. PMI_546]
MRTASLLASPTLVLVAGWLSLSACLSHFLSSVNVHLTSSLASTSLCLSQVWRRAASGWPRLTSRGSCLRRCLEVGGNTGLRLTTTSTLLCHPQPDPWIPPKCGAFVEHRTIPAGCSDMLQYAAPQDPTSG